MTTREDEYYEGYGCAHLGSWLSFTPRGLSHCCIAYGAAAEPAVPGEYSGGPFDRAAYFASVKEYVKNNQQRKGPCRGCVYLRMGRYAAGFTQFKFIGLNHFVDNAAEPPYDVVPCLQELHDGQMLAKNAFISLESGEASRYPHLVGLGDFIIRNNYGARFNTNALSFSGDIADILRDGRKLRYAQLTLKNATPETYRNATGSDGFPLIVENAVRYSQLTERGSVVLRYVLPLASMNGVEYAGFLQLASDVRRRFVRIAPDVDQYVGNRAEYMKSATPFIRDLTHDLKKMDVDVKYSIFTPDELASIKE